MADLQLRRYSNQAPETTLNGSVSVTDTSLAVVTASGFPAAPFTIEIEGEIILVGAKSGTTLSSLQRGYDGSIPAEAHPDGATVKHVLTANDFTHRWQDTVVSRDWGDLDDEFDDGDHSALASVRPSGSVTWTEANGVLSAVFSGQGNADCVAKVKTISTLGIGSGVQTAVRVGAVNNYAMAGPIFSAGGTTTDSVVWQFAYLAPTTDAYIHFDLRSGIFSNVNVTSFSDGGLWSSGWIHMRLVWTGINSFRAWWSTDGVSWTDFGKGAFSITGINPPTRMGVGVSSWGGATQATASFEYLRVWTP